MRSRDLRILAIGKIRYTQDIRFTPLNEVGNDVWVLKIRNARFSDSGSYECQVSYHDDMEMKLKMPVYLQVLGTYIININYIGKSLEDILGSIIILSCSTK